MYKGIICKKETDDGNQGMSSGGGRSTTNTNTSTASLSDTEGLNNQLGVSMIPANLNGAQFTTVDINPVNSTNSGGGDDVISEITQRRSKPLPVAY